MPQKQSRAQLFDLRDWALERVAAMRKISLAAFGSKIDFQAKPDGTPVTVIDRKCESLFRDTVSRDYPQHGVWGEEFGKSGPSSHWVWVIDPIDGTRPFSRGLPSWGSLITLTYKGEPVMAVVDYPVFSATLWAIKGEGAWEGLPRGGAKGDRQLHVSSVSSLSRSVILHAGANCFMGKDLERPIAQMLKSCYLERGYGDCYAYWHLLRGSADMMLDFSVNIWDLAPMLLLLEEAGGCLFDFQGKRRWEGPSAVSGNPKIVSLFLRAVKEKSLRDRVKA